MAQSLTFDEHQRLYLNSHPVPEPRTDTEVVLRMLASPINPIDLLVLADRYMVKPKTFEADLPVPGYDGVGVVVAVGSQVTTLKPGSRAIVGVHGRGTWRTHGTFDEADLLPVPSRISPTQGAILRLSVAVAWQLLHDHAEALLPGDWVICNAATSAMAHFLMQLVQRQGFKALAVVRDRDEETFNRLCRVLRAHGADEIVQESTLMRAITQPASPLLAGKSLKLAVDSVGGTTGEALASALSPTGTYVATGFLGSGLGPNAHIRVTPKMVWGDQKIIKGFRFSKSWAALGGKKQRDILHHLADLLIEEKLKMPLLEVVHWDPKGDPEGDIVEKVTRLLEMARKAELGSRKAAIIFRLEEN